ncbi:MAG TPA: GNAT family N-acetyltransferase [Solirubrobacteraceae bacterium]|jgi:RimJ/RimL family protein N-acetyltransferase|nr:GNAT family N-acetyltransferase [Solirubrobacteraceae bacterium]
MDLTPLYGLRLRTDRLELRWPDEEEIAALGRLAQTGVHEPAEMPFLVPWTDGIGGPGFVEEFTDFHLGLRRDWRPDDWQLELGVWAADELIGVQGVVGHGFATSHEAKTGSWLAQRFQGRGFGTEMRAAVLELAFHGLGAEAALSSALDGVDASLRVSQKLGYIEDGQSWVDVRGQRRLDRKLRLTRDRWIDQERISVRISGLETCIPLFGLDRPPEPWVPSC